MDVPQIVYKDSRDSPVIIIGRPLFQGCKEKTQKGKLGKHRQKSEKKIKKNLPVASNRPFWHPSK